MDDFDFSPSTDSSGNKYLNPGIEFSVKFIDFSRDAYCIFISTDDQKKKQFIEDFCAKTKYKFIDFPFAYSDSLHDHSLCAIDSIRKEVQQIKARADEIDKKLDELRKSYQFTDPMLFDYSIELRENPETKNKFYRTEKTLVSKNAKSKMVITMIRQTHQKKTYLRSTTVQYRLTSNLATSTR